MTEDIRAWFTGTTKKIKTISLVSEVNKRSMLLKITNKKIPETKNNANVKKQKVQIPIGARNACVTPSQGGLPVLK